MQILKVDIDVDEDHWLLLRVKTKWIFAEVIFTFYCLVSIAVFLVLFFFLIFVISQENAL